MEHFTYAGSHDLKSPLWTVKTFLGFVEQDVAAGAEMSQIQKSLGHIRGAAERMTRLLDELLRMSRVGRQEHAPARLPLNEVIDEALGAVAGRIAERNVIVTNRTEPVTLFADRSRLVEVWQNLLDNAVKYMGDQPRPEIEMGIERKGRVMLFYFVTNGLRPSNGSPRYHKEVFDCSRGSTTRATAPASSRSGEAAFVECTAAPSGWSRPARAEGPSLSSACRVPSQGRARAARPCA
jgi:light-regulated signal transduction histidine kinase (bacteriophytochrome)